jgi:hypothetical protein
MADITHKLTYNNTEDLDYAHDAQQIVDRLAAMGYEISLVDAHRAWEDYSNGMCAGWMNLPEDDDQLFYNLIGRCTQKSV